MNPYLEAVRTVFSILTKGASVPYSPVLLCLPDLLVLRGKKGPTPEEVLTVRPDRITISLSWGLDGHACISAMTAGYLALGLHADFETWLVAKVGRRGQELLSFAEKEISHYADGMFKCFQAEGIDRHIETPSNTDEQVTREIEEANDVNQLSLKEFKSFGLMPWLDDRPYGLLIGDAESDLFTKSYNEINYLCSKASSVVIDTAIFKDEPDRSRMLWKSVCNLARLNSRTFVSISDVDAKVLAGCLGNSELESMGDIVSVLQNSLPSGHLVLHTSKFNAAFFKDGYAEPVIVPTCDIKPKKGTNGAGDTFNGGLALAAMALQSYKKDTVDYSADEINQAVTFATAIVSLRLMTGNYPTRAEFITSIGNLSPRRVDSEMIESLLIGKQPFSPRLNHSRRGKNDLPSASGWDDLPKLFLVDLDHTLCDSKKWRIQATMQAVNMLDLHWPDKDVLEVYEHLYTNHQVFKTLLGENLRYCWNLEDLFYLFYHLKQIPRDQRIGKINFSEGNSAKFDSEMNNLARQLWGLKQNEYVRSAVERATTVMKKSAVFAYTDAIAALYRLRDELKFQLRLVTEGDGSAQRWKVEKLGLSRLFPDSCQNVEDAFVSHQQLLNAFTMAFSKIDHNSRSELEKAQAVCIKIQNTLKRNFRGRVLRDCVSELCHNRNDSFGVFACTLGDRIEADVAPYIELRKKICSEKGKRNLGLVVVRIERGPYAHINDNGNDVMPDISVKSFDALTEKLARPGFWRGKQPIRRDDISFSLSPSEMLSDEERELLLRVGAQHPGIGCIVEKVIERLDGGS